jgi:hypothetical protein
VKLLYLDYTVLLWVKAILLENKLRYNGYCKKVEQNINGVNNNNEGRGVA